jgi:LCP family protein required for cell wall assembly
MKTSFGLRYRLVGISSALVLGAAVVMVRLMSCADPVEPDADDPGAWSGADLSLGSAPVDAGSADGGIADDPILPPIDFLSDVEGTEYILLLGFDDWTRLPGRTDSIMIVAARHDSGDVGVISVPRDLWVYIPGAEPGRINKVFRVGNRMHGPGGGHKLIKQVVERELGFPISYTAAVDYKGFEAIVDDLGGIEVDVECPIKDNFISPGSKTGYEKLWVGAGRRRLDGRTALLFARSRHGRTDLDRARRQQAVLLGLKRRLTRLDMIPRLPSLFDQLKDHVATDLDLPGAYRLARLGATAGPGMVHGMVIGPPVVFSWKSPEGKAVLRLNREELKKAVDNLFLAPAPGYRGKPVCPSPNAAINWREKARKYRERKRAAKRLAAADGGVEDLPEPADLAASPY